MLGWELPPHNSGGLGVACYYMARALAGRGVDIDFILPYSAKHPDIDWMKIHAAVPVEVVTDVKDERAVSTLAYSQSYEELHQLQRRYIRYVENLVRREQFDVIHAHDWLTMEAGMAAKRASGLPLIVHVHATEFDRSGSKSGNPLIHEIEYQGLVMADKIFAVSEITKNIIIEKYGIPAEKIAVTHNAIDVETLAGYCYDKHDYRYLESLRDEGYTVISTVGRMTVQKGLHQLVQALARASERYDKLVLLLAGDGEQRDELLRLSADLGISDKIFFTGFVRGRRWRDTYSVSDVFVMSSVSEPFGITALEAAHHNTALIITKQSGVGEVLNSVLRYDFWDVDRLADQMIAIATSPALKESLRENVKHEYTRLSWHDVADICLKVYHNLAREGVTL